MKAPEELNLQITVLEEATNESAEKLDLQITVLEESIQHWEENVLAVQRGESPDLAASSCACCDEWRWADEGECAGCPIFEHTGVSGCGNTPYMSFYRADIVYLDPESDRNDWEVLLACANDELDFLNTVMKKLKEGSNEDA